MRVKLAVRVLSVIFLLTSIIYPTSANSAAHGTVLGTVTGSSVSYTYGNHGSVNSIVLIVNADFSGYIGIVCERRHANLGVCVRWLRERDLLEERGDPSANVIRAEGMYLAVPGHLGCHYFSPRLMSHTTDR